ncbi:hypothetical protein GCM10017776_61330 [Streptomyces griseoluteus]|nr:hypothetical protein GCM10017776_61330 [Streptomyces griseoluteus]
MPGRSACSDRDSAANAAGRLAPTSARASTPVPAPRRTADRLDCCFTLAGIARLPGRRRPEQGGTVLTISGSRTGRLPAVRASPPVRRRRCRLLRPGERSTYPRGRRDNGLTCVSNDRAPRTGESRTGHNPSGPYAFYVVRVTARYDFWKAGNL